MAIRVSNVTAQALMQPNEIPRSVSQTITFVQEPFARTIEVINTTFQILQLQAGKFAGASDTMALADGVVFFLAIADRTIVEDVLNFQQTILDSGNIQFVADVINFTDTGRSSILNQVLGHNVFFLQYAVPCFGAPWSAIAIEDVISFEDTASKVEAVSVTSTISFTDSAEQQWGVVGDGHFIDFVQAVTVGFGATASSTLSFSQDIESFSDYLRVVEHGDVVEHSMTYYIDNGCSQKTYNQFVGDGPLAEPIPEQGLLFDSDFALESIIDGTLLILRNPEPDDNDRLAFQRINRETRGGELNVYSDPDWGKVNTLLFTITALPDGGGNCPDTIEAVLTFFLNNLGAEIFLHDWTGVSWKGVVTTPDEIAVEDADGYWTLAFEFEGVPEAGSVPQNVVAFQDTLSFNADWTRSISDVLEFVEDVHAGGDINIDVTQTLNLQDSLAGSDQEITLLSDDMSAGATSVTLDGQSPDTGTNTWRSHTDILDDGTMDSPIDAGAYYRFTPVSGTRYQLTCNSAFMNTYSDADNGIWGFFEDQSASNSISGTSADGTLDPTCAKAVHLMRETDGGTRNNAYRLGSESDGTANTVAWTDGTLNASPDAVLDLRIILDTTGGATNWTAQWFAKATISGSYTEVGPETDLFSENIGAVGWAADSIEVEPQQTGIIELLELRPIG